MLMITYFFVKTREMVVSTNFGPPAVNKTTDNHSKNDYFAVWRTKKAFENKAQTMKARSHHKQNLTLPGNTIVKL